MVLVLSREVEMKIHKILSDAGLTLVILSAPLQLFGAEFWLWFTALVVGCALSVLSWIRPIRNL